MPNDPSHQAQINNDPALSVTVTLDQDATVRGLKVNADDRLTFGDYRTLRLVKDGATDPTVTNDGLITLGSTGGGAYLVADGGQTTLTGAGQMVVEGSNYWNNQLSSQNGGSVVNASGHTIRGCGTISGQLINQGQVVADGATLSLSSAEVTNAGVLQAINGGVLNLYWSTVNDGQIAAGGHTVQLNYATLNNTNLQAQEVQVSGFSNFVNDSTFTTSKLMVATDQLVLRGATTATQGDILLKDTGYLQFTATGSGTPTFTHSGSLTLDATSGSGGGYLWADGLALTLSGPTDTLMLGTYYGHNQIVSQNGGSVVNASGHTIRGCGTISGQLVNQGRLVADHETLAIYGAVSGAGRVEVANGATLRIGSYSSLETGDFFMSQTASLVMEHYSSLALQRNFAFAQTDETLWSLGYARLEMKGAGGVQQALEIGGRDFGLADDGFTANFNLPQLRLSGANTYASLVDLIDNGNRSSAEALYVDLLEVLPGTTLCLNNLHLYTWLNGELHLVLAREGDLFGGGKIIDAAVPVPPSVVLLGSALAGLMGARRWFQKG